ncbi:phosphomannomutase/phosphoglucomutase [Dyella sp.]|jgi:phosphomannomutase/phosphoglucomutase|uniref:phosphomannomutase/phosphoglucomutase n=1 Tax=Dyella sp. TaxID=1869338 RepID=UPI002D78601C|nr:phosphomannomutase/phosphoglucomutase [Dyella sp.]HET6433768.1 phosphomannomutase/phosphoglucomutase [Dyella sp.]
MGLTWNGNGRGEATDWLRLLPLAAGTLLLLLGLFSAWQTWLIADEGHANDRVHQAQEQAVQQVGAELDRQRAMIRTVLDRIDPALVASDPAAAAAAVRNALPQALHVQFFSAGMDEVLHANYREFGYAKAAQLMAAQNVEGPPLAQTVNAGGDRRLSFVMPMGNTIRPSAWVWVELPFAPVEKIFNAISPGSGRIDLRQGDDASALSLLSHGAASVVPEDGAAPIAGSNFSIGAALPAAFIVLPRPWPVAAFLALIGLLGGAYLLHRAGRRRALPAVAPEEEEEIPLPAPVRRREPATARALPPPAPSAPPPAQLDPTIFRAYDVRGVVGKTLDRHVARLLGLAIGSVMREKGLPEIVVGRDGRLSGPELAGALADGLRAAGIDVIDIGAAPTPVVYYAAFRFNTGCGVAVTGSHNPPDYNGFKIVIGGETLAEDAIQDLYRRIVSGALDEDGHGALRSVDVVPDYIERIASDVQAERSLKVVVDCGNGIAGAVAPQVVEAVGCEVIPLYCDVDGEFPNHHPDPSDPKNLEDLILAVRQTGADLGVAFDGDGDRLGVVTREGEIIFPDRTLMLFARDVLSRQPGATIIYDVKCTGHLKGQILDAGGSPLMWRTGHSLIKAKMRETGAELAGEMSGHFFFKERWYGFDDGIYACARLLEILAGDLEGRSPEQIFDSCPKGVSTPELKIELAEGEHQRFMEVFREKASFPDATLVTIDGVRADWADGWGLVRASNTTPVLVLRFDADNPTALKRIQQVFRSQLFLVNAGLKLPF